MSGEAPWTGSALDKAVQKEGKLSSFMWCQTELKGAEMTADSVTEVEVGIRDAILWEVCCIEFLGVVKSDVLELIGEKSGVIEVKNGMRGKHLQAG